MRKITSEARFSNNIQTGKSSLYYESSQRLLQPLCPFKDSKIQAKYLIINNLFNVFQGNFTIKSRGTELHIYIKDGVYTYDGLLEVINSQLKNKLSVQFEPEEEEAGSDPFANKFKLSNNEAIPITLIGQSYLFYILGFINYQQCLLNKPCEFNMKANDSKEFDMDLYIGLNICNVSYCSQHFFTISFNRKMLLDNWMGVTNNIMLRLPSDKLGIDILDQINAVIKIRNIFNIDIKSDYAQINCNITFVPE